MPTEAGTMFMSFSPKAIGMRASAEDAIDAAAAAGFGGVDLLVKDVVESGSAPAELRRRMADAGLLPGAWSLPIDWRGPKEPFVAELSELPRYSAIAADLGLCRTCTWVMPECLDSGDSTSVDDPRLGTFDFHVDRLGAIARVLDRDGIRLGLEVIGVREFRSGKRPTFIHRMGLLPPLLEALEANHKNIGILADVFHLHAAGEEFDQLFAWGGSRIVWAHVSGSRAEEVGGIESLQDWDRDLPAADGVVEVRGFLERLSGAGFRGPVTPEPLGRCRVLAGKSLREAAVLVAEAMRGVWPNE